MKISGYRIHVTVPPQPPPDRPGYRASWVFLEIETDLGVVGLGECSNWPHDGDLVVATALQRVMETLVGRDPEHIEAIWREVFGRYTYLGNRGLITTVLSAIDMALWDIKGQALERPVFDLLGGAVRDRLPLYTHPGGGGDPDVAAANTVALIDAGFRAFKFDPFAESGPRHTDYRGGGISRAGVRQGAEVIEAVRAAAGPDVDIMIDFHGLYNVESALRCIRALEPFDITWFEEPLPPEGLDALRQVRRQTAAPLCVGERLHTRWDFLPVLREQLVNFVMPDVSWTGGVSELKKIATLAETFFVPIAPHGALGPVQVVAGAQVMMSVPNLFRVEILGPSVVALFDECLDRPLDISDGHLDVSSRPGLGIALDQDYVAAHAHPEWPSG